jgi:hypothetical protein
MAKSFVIQCVNDSVLVIECELWCILAKSFVIQSELWCILAKSFVET